MENVHIILGAPKKEEISPLIQSNGIIIGVDRGALFAIEENLKIDIALGDFDSISPLEKERIERDGTKNSSFPNR